MEGDQDDAPEMTVGQLRAWLLGLDEHSPDEVYHICRKIYLTKVGDLDESEQRKIQQVLELYNLVPDSPLDKTLRNLLGTFQMSNLGWDYGSAEWGLTKHIIGSFLTATRR